MKKRSILSYLFLVIFLFSCNPHIDDSTTSTTSPTDTTTTGIPNWDGEQILYEAKDIARFGSATPSGVANYNEAKDEVVIWNTDASLDNYGGVQTPMLTLDFSKAVIFEMGVISCYSEYVIKLAVEGVNETFYVLADEGETGLISVNLVDSMLSEKFANRRTSPDPGYEHGWRFKNESKKCSFHLLAKGPDGERQTAELVLSHLAIYNNTEAVTSVVINSSSIENNKISQLKNATPIQLSASLLPLTIENQNIIWSSENNNIASISSSGLLSFVNVGQTKIRAKSYIDQSKYKEIIVNVLSGYENPNDLKSKLNTLSYNGQSSDVELFIDLFNTTWGSNIFQEVNEETLLAINRHDQDEKVIFENYLKDEVTHQNEAETHRQGNNAYFRLNLNNVTNGVVYRLIENRLYKEESVSFVSVLYAFYQNKWISSNNYLEKTILVYNNSVYKYEIELLKSSLVANYSPLDFFQTSEWVVPDRLKLSEDRVIHALSPATIFLQNDDVYLKQNKYPEAKYCFGGIVSKVLSVNENKDLTILLNMIYLNQKSDYVKTMWEIKILYYDTQGINAINTNPLKVMSNNQKGFFEHTFTPAYPNFRLYLVVNGSDIGEQFSEATMGLDLLKLYSLR